MKKIYPALFLSFLAFPLFSNNSIEIKSCEGAISFALNHNKSLSLSRKLSSYDLLKAKKTIGTFIPQVNLSLSDAAVVNFNSSDYKSKNLTLGLSWLVYDGGERKLEYRLKILESRFSRLEVEEEIKNQCLEIMEIYLEYQKAIRNREVLIKSLENAKLWKTALEKEYEFGLILETEVMEYEIKKLEIEKTLVTQEDELVQLELNLKNLLGIKAEENLEIPINENIFNVNEIFNEDLNSMFNKVLNNSIEYKKLKLELEYSDKIEKIQNSYLLPEISLQPGISFQGEDFPLRGPKYQVMVSLSFERNPFFSVQGSQTVAFEKKSLTEATTYGQSGSTNNFDFRETKKIEKLNRQKEIFNIWDYEENLKNSIQKILMEHRQLLASIKILEKDININEKLQSVLIKEVEQGTKRPMDLLEQEISLSEKKVSLYDAFVQCAMIEKEIDFLINPNTGDYINAFSE